MIEKLPLLAAIHLRPPFNMNSFEKYHKSKLYILQEQLLLSLWKIATVFIDAMNETFDKQGKSRREEKVESKTEVSKTKGERASHQETSDSFTHYGSFGVPLRYTCSLEAPNKQNKFSNLMFSAASANNRHKVNIGSPAVVETPLRYRRSIEATYKETLVDDLSSSEGIEDDDQEDVSRNKKHIGEFDYVKKRKRLRMVTKKRPNEFHSRRDNPFFFRSRKWRHQVFHASRHYLKDKERPHRLELGRTRGRQGWSRNYCYNYPCQYGGECISGIRGYR